MSEKEKTKKETKEEGKEKATDTKDAGDKPKADDEVESEDPRDERIEELQRKVDVLERSGKAEAGLKEPEKPKETDEEYADRVARGEANPLKDDGFVS